jgi:hypothetical protein
MDRGLPAVLAEQRTAETATGGRRRMPVPRPELTGSERQALHDADQTWVTHSRKFHLCLNPDFEAHGQAVCGCTIPGRRDAASAARDK